MKTKHTNTHYSEIWFTERTKSSSTLSTRETHRTYTLKSSRLAYRFYIVNVPANHFSCLYTVLCKSLLASLISFYFTSKQPDFFFLSFFKMLLSSSFFSFGHWLPFHIFSPGFVPDHFQRYIFVFVVYLFVFLSQVIFLMKHKGMRGISRPLHRNVQPHENDKSYSITFERFSSKSFPIRIFRKECLKWQISGVEARDHAASLSLHCQAIYASNS